MIQGHYLTRQQEERGFEIKNADHHVVELWCKDVLVGRYSSDGVSIAQLQQDADTWMNGIQFGGN